MTAIILFALPFAALVVTAIVFTQKNSRVRVELHRTRESVQHFADLWRASLARAKHAEKQLSILNNDVSRKRLEAIRAALDAPAESFQ